MFNFFRLDFQDDYGGEDFEISASGQDAGDDRFD